jgi:uncharacterized protein YjbI with pentapeptide repeats
MTRFIGTTFSGQARFDNATFFDAGFREVDFQKDCGFSKATFHRKVNFSRVTFKGKTSFAQARLRGNLLELDDSGNPKVTRDWP